MDKLTLLLREQSDLIAKLEATAAAVEQELKLAYAKMDGLRAASSAIGQDTGDIPIRIEPHNDVPRWPETIPLKRNTSVQPSNFVARRKKRPLQEQWKSILQYINMAEGAKLDEVCQLYPELKRKNISSQLSYYEKQGYLVVDGSSGSYSVTDSGRVACGLP